MDVAERLELTGEVTEVIHGATRAQQLNDLSWVLEHGKLWQSSADWCRNVQTWLLDGSTRTLTHRRADRLWRILRAAGVRLRLGDEADRPEPTLEERRKARQRGGPAWRAAKFPGWLTGGGQTLPQKGGIR